MSDLDGWLTQGVVTTKIYCRPDEAVPAGSVVRHLSYRAPLDAAALLAFFGRRAVPGIEEIDGEVYRRSLRLAGGFGVVELRAARDVVAVRLWLDDPRDEAEALARVRVMLDLDADPEAVAAALGVDPVIGSFVAADPGRRVPGAADPDEIAVRAVLGQQVSLAGAATLAGRIVAAYGDPLARPIGGVTHAWPAADALADAAVAKQTHLDHPYGGPSDFACEDPWAMPASRRRAIGALTAALASGDVTLDPGADPGAVEAELLALPGIGPWTASYIRMRALGDRDAFLASDLGVKHALDRLGCDSRPRAAESLSQAWRPFRAYALQHLWAVAS